MTGFALRVDDEIDLVLREAWTNPLVADLIARNITRLREWEPWAQGDPDPDRQAAYALASLHGWVDGTNVPTVIRWNERVVGTIGARIDPVHGVAQLGYWLDRDAEGHGIVTRAARALLGLLFGRYPVERIEIRCAAHNARSRAVAERLGFIYEGTLRASFAVGDERQDEAVFGLLRSDAVR